LCQTFPNPPQFNQSRPHRWTTPPDILDFLALVRNVGQGPDRRAVRRGSRPRPPRRPRQLITGPVAKAWVAGSPSGAEAASSYDAGRCLLAGGSARSCAIVSPSRRSIRVPAKAQLRAGRRRLPRVQTAASVLGLASSRMGVVASVSGRLRSKPGTRSFPAIRTLRQPSGCNAGSASVPPGTPASWG
jgi:hypothetical protein